MKLPESGFHGFRTMVRKIGRLSQEDKAKLFHLLEPNPVMRAGDKEKYDALTEEQKTDFDAFIIRIWHIGMEQVLLVLEQLIADGTVRILHDPGMAEWGNHGKSHFQETTGTHPPDMKQSGRRASEDERFETGTPGPETSDSGREPRI